MKRGGTVSGAASLVMIFCVLCMAVFAALTFVTANRERTLAELNARRAAEFYRADYDATRIAAALRGGDFDGAAKLLNDTAASQTLTLDGDGAELPQTFALDADGAEFPEIRYTETDAGTLAEFSLPAGGEQRLEVRLLLRGGDMDVVSWKKVYAGEWQTDDIITLAEIN